MIKTSLKTVCILPHLDDEFALIPLLDQFSREKIENLKIVYCAEKLKSKSRYLRRRENHQSLHILGCSFDQVTYLNDYFLVDDLELHLSSKLIYHFLVRFVNVNKIKQILTLNFEGGHPDHDSLALLVEKISRELDIFPFYFPAYNARRQTLIPLSLFKPIRSQEYLFSSITYRSFCWLKLFSLPFIYLSEYKAFLKLFPFFIPQVLFSRELLYSTTIDMLSVRWGKTLSWNIYKVSIQSIIKEIDSI